MKRDKRSDKIKSLFGNFLREERKFRGLSLHEVGYVFNQHHSTFGQWEVGVNFPRSVVAIKKVHLLFPDTPKILTRIFDTSGVKPTKRDWTKFKKIIKGNKEKTFHRCSGGDKSRYQFKDSREIGCRMAFGAYLRRERLSRGLSAKTLAKACNLEYDNYMKIERCGLINDVKTILLLDRFYGNTLKVLFGLCAENGIHLSPIEKREFVSKLSEFENSGIHNRGKEIK
jgi:transcriptional regulator with XRE-family HTH domain